MRKIIFGFLAVAMGVFIIYAARTGGAALARTDSGLQMMYIVGAVFVVGGLDHMLRRRPQSRGREVVEGLVALGIAGWQVFNYLNVPHGSGPYAGGQLTGVIVFAGLFGVFGLYKLFKGA